MPFKLTVILTLKICRGTGEGAEKTCWVMMASKPESKNSCLSGLFILPPNLRKDKGDWNEMPKLDFYKVYVLISREPTSV